MDGQAAEKRVLQGEERFLDENSVRSRGVCQGQKSFAKEGALINHAADRGQVSAGERS